MMSFPLGRSSASPLLKSTSCKRQSYFVIETLELHDAAIQFVTQLRLDIPFEGRTGKNKTISSLGISLSPREGEPRSPKFSFAAPPRARHDDEEGKQDGHRIHVGGLPFVAAYGFFGLVVFVVGRTHYFAELSPS